MLPDLNFQSVLADNVSQDVFETVNPSLLSFDSSLPEIPYTWTFNDWNSICSDTFPPTQGNPEAQVLINGKRPSQDQNAVLHSLHGQYAPGEQNAAPCDQAGEDDEDGDDNSWTDWHPPLEPLGFEEGSTPSHIPENHSDEFARFATYTIQCYTDIIPAYERGILSDSLPRHDDAHFSEISRFWSSIKGRIEDLTRQALGVSKSGWAKTDLLKYPGVPMWRKKAIAMISVLSDEELTSPLNTKRQILLEELAGTLAALEKLRLRYVLDFHIDPESSHSDNLVMQVATSDSCATSDQDDIWHSELRNRLELFQLDKSMSYFKTEPLSRRRLRKDVRAWVRVVGYRCIRLSCNSMLIHKDREKLPRRPRAPPTRPTPFSDLAQRLSQYYAPPYESINPTWSYRDKKNTGYSSGSSCGSRASMGGGPITKKRRLPREEGGYTCDFSGCQMTYDRQCDLRQHKRSHVPNDQLPYPCEFCDKRFPYPKDLRRHEVSCRSKVMFEEVKKKVDVQVLNTYPGVKLPEQN